MTTLVNQLFSDIAEAQKAANQGMLNIATLMQEQTLNDAEYLRSKLNTALTEMEVNLNSIVYEYFRKRKELLEKAAQRINEIDEQFSYQAIVAPNNKTSN